MNIAESLDSAQRGETLWVQREGHGTQNDESIAEDISCSSNSDNSTKSSSPSSSSSSQEPRVHIDSTLEHSSNGEWTAFRLEAALSPPPPPTAHRQFDEPEPELQLRAQLESQPDLTRPSASGISSIEPILIGHSLSDRASKSTSISSGIGDIVSNVPKVSAKAIRGSMFGSLSRLAGDAFKGAKQATEQLAQAAQHAASTGDLTNITKVCLLSLFTCCSLTCQPI